MGSRSNASKVSKKASVGSGIEEIDISISKNTQRKAKTMLKHTSGKTFLNALVCLIVGVAIGFGLWFGVCRNDKFSIRGGEELSLILGKETYIDEGVDIVAFGKDEKDSVTVETNLKKDKEGKYYADDVGTYYIKYKSNCFKYGKMFKVEKIRLVSFVEISESEVEKPNEQK